MRRRSFLSVKGTEITVPYILITQEKTGPVAVITAGIHSAEYIGIQAAIELSNELTEDNICGSIIIAPLCNPSGFEHRTMSMVYEDGKNLNRVFPGSNSGSPSDRLADVLFSQLILKADIYIDLHSGDGYESLYPYVYYLGTTSTEETSKKMAECVNVPYAVRSNSFSGGAYNQASIHGIPSILLERGGQSFLDRTQIDADKEDVINILKCFGILEGDYRLYPQKTLAERDIVAPCTGCWYPNKSVGDSFVKGDLLGRITDYFGRTMYTCIAAEDGLVLHQISSLNVIKEDLLIAFGTDLQ